MWKQTDASAYVLVLVVMLAIFAALAMTLGLTSYEAKVTAAYGDYANTYNMAASGVENAQHFLNGLLAQYQESLETQISAPLQTENLTGSMEYVLPAPGEIYYGTFHPKADSGMNAIHFDTYRENAMAYINNAMDELLPNTAGGYAIETNIHINPLDYRITVEIQPQASGFKTVYKVTATAQKLGTNAQSTAQGILQWAEADYVQTVIPSYQWKSTIPFFQYPIITAGEVIAIGAEPPVAIYSDPSMDFTSEAVRADILLPVTGSHGDDPVLITNIPQEVDVSMFYRNGEPVPSLLINTGGGELSLYASDDINNAFHGIIVSHGSVLLENITVTGSVFSQQSVTLDNANVYADSDMIFKVRLSERQLEKRILDYLHITDFASMTTQRTEALGEILKNAILSNHYSLEITGLAGLKLKLASLRKISGD